MADESDRIVLKSSGEIGVVVISRNPQLEPLTAAILECTKVSSNIVLIDNGSSSNTQHELIKLGDRLSIDVIAHHNVGIAAAQNEAIRWLARTGVRYILFLDQDTAIDARSVRRLFETAEILTGSGIPVAAVGPTLGAAPSQRGWREEAFLASSGSLIPVSTVRAVGMFREEYFIDHVDKEWGLRALQAGYRSFRLTDLVVPHEFAEPGRSWRGRERRFHSAPVRSYYLVRNEILRWSDLGVHGADLLRDAWILLKWAIMTIVVGGHRAKRTAAMFRGAAHGVLGIAGEFGVPAAAHRAAPTLSEVGRPRTSPKELENSEQSEAITSRLDVTVIIVTFNSARVIAGALASIEAVLDRGGQCIVVDNASQDETRSIVAQIDDRIHLIDMPSNVGFAGAVNEAARHVVTRYLCLLNPDSHIAADDLAYLESRMRSDPTIGALAPLIVQGGSAVGNSGAYRFPTLWRTFLTFSGLSSLAGPRWLEGTVLLRRQISSPRDVDWLTGACVVSAKTVWDRVGGLSERWFMYAEDLDFGMRIRRSGLRSVVDPAVQIAHDVGTGSSTPPTVIEAAWLVNQWDFYRTEMAKIGLQRTAWKVVAGVFITARACAFAILSLKPDGDHFRARATWLLRCVVALAKQK